MGPFLWQKGLSIKGLSKGDVLVVCGDIHQLSSLRLALLAKCCGVRVVWWGHHATATSSPLSVKIRLWIAKKLSDVMLVYTHTGVGYLVRRGFASDRVFATGNTINQIPINKAISGYDGKDMFGGFLGILCCSVLREKVKLDLAIRALADIRLKDVRLAVIGDGPMKNKYEEVAKEAKVSDRILWLGATRDQDNMAPWFLSAKCFVYPGAVGLSILHSMSYGLPVVVHSNPAHQMPEYEIMEDGRTGVCFNEGDVQDLDNKLAWMIKNEGARQEMSAYCRKVALEKYSMNQMIENFARAVEVARDIG
jgi:glycosyltransferase involved in cell wall biosynthesis